MVFRLGSAPRRSIKPETRQPVGITMKLVSYNIQYTKGRDGRFDTARIVESL
jgi:endonuclease/exonuclease/phosphatase family metal-dependent hydrolase